jgi:hypothetical protein
MYSNNVVQFIRDSTDEINQNKQDYALSYLLLRCAGVLGECHPLIRWSQRHGCAPLQLYHVRLNSYSRYI